MGFFEGGGNELSDLMNQAPGQLFKIGRGVLGVLKPAIRDLQSARDQIALAKAAQQMRQQVQPPDSPAQSPGNNAPVWAVPDLTPPPRD
jgi:hypothetical protein